MEKYIVTLSRQFASMGSTIAHYMSDRLGIEYYDRDIVEQAARRMGLDLPLVCDAEEKGSPLLARLTDSLGSDMLVVQNDIFRVEAEIIRDFAHPDKPSCIIVGRCADSVLKDYPRVLNVYIYAPVEARVRNAVEKLGMDEKTARKTIAAVDRAREIYRLRYGDGVKNVLDRRDLMIDSSRFGPEKTAEMLCGIVKSAFE